MTTLHKFHINENLLCQNVSILLSTALNNNEWNLLKCKFILHAERCMTMPRENGW